ncbi:MAG: hypothetical protein MZV49_18005 [Rhodopseudomonas palustris]|nr:hypothetical protein [Rhodopseudomonas palustris]
MVNNAGILRDRIFHKHERRRMGGGDRSAPDTARFYVSRAAAPLLPASRSAARYVHMTSHLGADRQFRPGQLRGRQARHCRRCRKIDRARTCSASTCAPTASRPSPGAGMIGTIPTDTPEQQARVATHAADGGRPRSRRWRSTCSATPRQGRHRPDLRGARQRDLPDVASRGRCARCIAAKAGVHRASLCTACRPSSRHSTSSIAPPIFLAGCDLSDLRDQTCRSGRGAGGDTASEREVTSPRTRSGGSGCDLRHCHCWRSASMSHSQPR